MLKQHKVTGKKYLCYHHGTLESCYTYTGSGTYWREHIKKHGKKINTIILLESDNKDSIKAAGLQYSDLWNVVESNEFANLVREDGSGGHEAMQTPDARSRAANTLRTRLASGNLTEKEKLRGTKQRARIQKVGFTEAELKSHKEISARQTGKTMKDRLNNPDYTDPRTGKSATEIFGETYTGPWNKGKAVKDLKGDNYVDPRCKPFTITSHLGVHKYNNEREFIESTQFSQPMLVKLKREGMYTVKRQSNTKHPFIHGETILFNIIQ